MGNMAAGYMIISLCLMKQRACVCMCVRARVCYNNGSICILPFYLLLYCSRLPAAVVVCHISF